MASTNAGMGPTSNIRAVLFDAEGVVIDTEAAWDSAQETFLARRAISYERSRVKPLLSGRTLAEGASLLQSMYDYPGDVASHVEERRAIMRELLGVGAAFVPGFESFFSVVSKTYSVALATAMDVELFDIVDRQLGLRELFGDRVVTLRDVGFRAKPAPDLFLSAAQMLRVAPSNCAVIEDAPLGIAAALKAGMFAIALTTTYRRNLLTSAHLVCSSFVEILAAL